MILKILFSTARKRLISSYISYLPLLRKVFWKPSYSIFVTRFFPIKLLALFDMIRILYCILFVISNADMISYNKYFVCCNCPAIFWELSTNRFGIRLINYQTNEYFSTVDCQRQTLKGICGLNLEIFLSLKIYIYNKNESSLWFIYNPLGTDTNTYL